MSGVLQVVGALCVLIAYIVSQATGRSTSPSLSVLNLVGSATLAVLAAVDRQWGFLLLEGSWAVVSAAGLARLPLVARARRR
jgi:hypothetical protein